MAPNAELPKPPPNRKLNQHGVNGAYYAGDWVDMEDLGSTFHPSSSQTSGESFKKKCQGCPVYDDCRSRSKMKCSKDKDKSGVEYDIVLVGAGCIGSAIARELSRYKLSVLLVEAADGKLCTLRLHLSTVHNYGWIYVYICFIFKPVLYLFLNVIIPFDRCFSGCN